MGDLPESTRLEQAAGAALLKARNGEPAASAAVEPAAKLARKARAKAEPKAAAEPADEDTTPDMFDPDMFEEMLDGIDGGAGGVDSGAGGVDSGPEIGDV